MAALSEVKMTDTVTESCDHLKLIEELRREVCFWKLQYNLAQKNGLLTSEKCSSVLVPEPCISADEVDYSDLPPLERISNSSDCESELDSEFDGMPSLEPIEVEENSHSEQTSCTSEGSTCSSTCNKSVIPCEVMISGFPYGISEADILGIFRAYSPVMCRIMINGPSTDKKQLSYAYVYLPNAELAEAAETELNFTMYRNHILEVKRICV